MHDIEKRISDIEDTQKIILAQIEALTTLLYQFGSGAAKTLMACNQLNVVMKSDPNASPLFPVAAQALLPQSPRKPRQSKGDKLIKAFRPSTVEKMNTLQSCWPTTRGTGDDTKRIPNDVVQAAARFEAILNEHKEVEEEDLFQSTLEYLATKPTSANAMQFYYGTGKPGQLPPWEVELRGYLTRKQKENQ